MHFGDNPEPFDAPPAVPDFSINFGRLRELKKVQTGALAFVLEQWSSNFRIDLAMDAPMKVARGQVRRVFGREQALWAGDSQIWNLPDEIRRKEGRSCRSKRHLAEGARLQLKCACQFQSRT